MERALKRMLDRDAAAELTSVVRDFDVWTVDELLRLYSTGDLERCVSLSTLDTMHQFVEEYDYPCEELIIHDLAFSKLLPSEIRSYIDSFDRFRSVAYLVDYNNWISTNNPSPYFVYALGDFVMTLEMGSLDIVGHISEERYRVFYDTREVFRYFLHSDSKEEEYTLERYHYGAWIFALDHLLTMNFSKDL